jgi:hypothetical protein
MEIRREMQIFRELERGGNGDREIKECTEDKR